MAALLVYKRVSNQQGIERVKRRMQASLFEIRLFNDDLRAILLAQGRFLTANLRYLALNLVPLLWLILPFVLVFVHLEPRYRYQGFDLADTAILKARLAAEAGSDRGGAAKPSMALRAPEGLRVTSPPVWNAGRREMVWRLEALQPGAYEVELAYDGADYPKEVRFSDRSGLFSRQRPASGLLAQLAHPAERPLPVASDLEALIVAYPERGWGRVPGTDIPFAWWFWWLVLMVAFGLLLRRPLGVQI